MADGKRPRSAGSPVSSLSPADLEAVEDTLDYEVQLESLNQWQLAWRRFKKHRLAVVGSAIFLGMVAMAVIVPTNASARPATPTSASSARPSS